MSSTALANSRDVVRRVIWVQAITIGWMTVEAVFALGAAWRAHSPALLAFGGDSAIELLSAVVVYWRFRSKWGGEQTEQLGARITGGLLFVLAAYVPSRACSRNTPPGSLRGVRSKTISSE